ncbi:MAG: hypothetical protein ACM3H8_00225 [Sphingobacteriales bacterium]
MKRKTAQSFLYLLFTIHSIVQAQDRSNDHNSSLSNKSATKAFNQNSSRSNHNRSYSLQSDAWSFGINTGASFGVNSNENTLFRGNSLATKMSGRYYFGNVGLGLSSGFIPGTISDNSLNNFLTERKLQKDQLQIQSGKPFNGYLAFGPSFRFGKRVQLAADLQGGMFLNNPGALSIGQLGAQRALYRFDGGSKNFYPGFSGNINIVYPISHTTHFFIATDYIQSKSSIRLVDLARGIDVPAEQTRNIKLFTVGLGITKSFGIARETGSGMATGRKHIANVKYEDIVLSKDAAAGQASGKRLLPTVNKREIAIDESGVHKILSPRDIATGRASGKRILPTVNKREIISPRDQASGLATGRAYRPGRPVYGNITRESCGPVTVKKTFPDGTIEEKTFACPDDAADYENITEQATGSSSDPQKSLVLPHVLEKSGIIHRDLAARNILLGRVTWSGNNTSGIVTNKSVSSLTNMGGGASTAAYARNGVATGAGAAAGAATLSKGVVTNIYVREAGSGMATGRRQYQPLYSEEDGVNHDAKLGSVKSNPLYDEKENSGTNPLYEGKNNLRTGGDNDCDGVAGLTVCLIDGNSGTTVATTHTETCGEFFFANVPSGNYIVKVAGAFLSKKGYDAYLSKRMDVAGELLTADDYCSIDLVADTGTVETAQALIKTKTKSNQSNDRTSNASGLIWSPRSNKTLNKAVGDLDGDGVTDIIAGSTFTGFGEKVSAGLHAAGGALSQGASLLGGALPGGAVISAAMMPGDPIPGLDVHLKSSSGSTADETFRTNEFGEFEFTDLNEGNYTISTEMNYYIDDEIIINVGDDDYIGKNINTSESNIKGLVKTSASQNQQTLKTKNNSMPNRISMNVTVPKQTQGTTFGEKANAGLVDNNNPTTRAQNNNTVRSNRTDNAIIIADLDGDGEMESSYMNINGEIATINITEPNVNYTQGTNAAGGINITEPGMYKSSTGVKQTMQTQVMKTNPNNNRPIKWMAPEVISNKVWGDPHVDEKDGTLKLGEGNFGKVYQGKWKCQDVAIKAISCSDGACVAITAKGDDFPAVSSISLNGLPPGEPVIKASVFFVDNNGKTYKRETDANGRLSLNGLPPGIPLRMLMNMGVDGNYDILITFTTDAQGNTISNVLKTKHDTVKNSIGNIR